MKILLKQNCIYIFKVNFKEVLDKIIEFILNL